MRVFICLLSFFLSIQMLYSQPWLDIPPDQRDQPEMSLFNHQKAFYDYWAPKNVDASGYYMENGVRKKAAGWKQFKRWEAYWEPRVDHVTGAFPDQNDYDRAERAYQKHRQRTDQGNWTNMGPWDSWGGYWGVGRINHIAFHPDDPNTFLVTTPQGGVWMTTNGGGDWVPLTDDQEVMATTAITVRPDFATSQTIYVGTGEMDAYEHSGGVGIIKSEDGGNTWQSAGLVFDPADGYSVNKILIHPDNYQIIYAATSNGIYKTTDGGANWTWTYGEPHICDLEFKPGDPSTLFAANKHWGRIYRLLNDGAIVDMVYDEWDNGVRRIELAVCPSLPSRVYAVGVDEEGGMYSMLRSDDSGATYSTIFTPGPSQAAPNLLNINLLGDDTGGQGWYDIALIVDPENYNHIYCGGINTWESYNGGTSWTLNNFWTDFFCPDCEIAHADKHYFAYNGNTLYESNDGGLYKTNDGQNWTVISDGIINSQMYKLGVSLQHPQHILTGLQDNGVKQFHEGTWTNKAGGDGMDCYYDYQDEDIQYYILQRGTNFYRTTDNWQTKTDIKPEGSEGAWTTPYHVKRWDGNTIYAGFQHVYKSTDRGDTWDIIFNQNSESRFRCLATTTSNDQLIWASDRYNIWKTNNGGSSWTEVKDGLPGNMVTDIEIHPYNENIVWVTMGEFDEHGVYRTTDGGSHWTNISAGLPPVPVNCVVNHWFNFDNDELYAGTDFGVYVKIGDDPWQFFNNGMPKVSVRELEISYGGRGKEGERAGYDWIRAATYGRGLWESNCYSVGVPPVCNFTVDRTFIASGESVQFSDLTTNTTFRYWEFEGGAPGWSNDPNPTVSYDLPGIYRVSLSANNAHGECEKIEDEYIWVVCEGINYKAEKAQSLEGPYTDLGNMGNTIYTSNKDNANSSPINIGFEFDFNCRTFTQFVLNTNGFIRLGDQPPSTASLFYDAAVGNDNGLFNSTNPADVNLISPFNHDLTSAGNAEYRVYTSGTQPNRVCTIQFEGLREKTTDPVRQYNEIEFQIKLYETSNNVEFVYGDWIPSGNASAYKSAAGGLKGSSSADEDLLVVGKNSTAEWSNVYFDNTNYLPGGYGLNFGAPPERPKPDVGRTYSFSPIKFNDNAIQQVYMLGKSSIYFSNPVEISALIQNKGYQTAVDLPVTIETSGANNNLWLNELFGNLEAGETESYETLLYSPQNMGFSTITLSIAPDEFMPDNSISLLHEATDYEISYAQDETPSTAYGYLPDLDGVFLNRHKIRGTAKIVSVEVYLFDWVDNLGERISAVVMDLQGTILGESDPLVMNQEKIGDWYSFPILTPPTIEGSDFLVGLRQYPSLSGNQFYPMSVQDEVPNRGNTYYTSNVDGTELEARDTDFNYRHMIGLTLEPIYSVGQVTIGEEMICEGETALLQLSFPDDGILWQSSGDGVNWDDIPGATMADFTTDPLQTDTYFRAKVTFPGPIILYSNAVFVTVYPEFHLTESYELCSGEDHVFPDGSMFNNITEDIVHTSYLTSEHDCDSTIETTLNVLPVYQVNEEFDICAGENYTFPDGFSEQNIQENTMHTSHLLSINGCDSIVETILHVHADYFGSEYFDLCEGDNFQFPDGSQTENITTDLVHTNELLSVFGCDSTIETHLTVYPVYSISGEVYICEGDDFIYPDGTQVTNVTSDQVHISELSTEMGCDSSIETSLRVLPAYFVPEEVTICRGDDFTFPDGTTISNVQQEINHLSELISVDGCDSLIETLVLVEPTYDLTEELDLCKGDSFTFPDGTNALNIQQDMEYVSHLVSSEGCDSLITTKINVIDLGVGITIFENTLIAYPNDLSYQWVNCDQDFELVANATGQSFEAIQSGNYAVVGDDGTCQDTSDCKYIIGTASEDWQVNGVRIYPNPVNRRLIIESLHKKILTFEMVTMTGERVNVFSDRSNPFIFQLELGKGGIPAGVYLLKVVIEGEMELFKVIVQ